MINISKLTKCYGSYVAIHDISFEVDDGQIYGLVGFNGAGKTTLLKTVAGVYLPDKGKVTFDGHDAHGQRSVERAVFIVADEPYFLLQATPDSMRAFYCGYYPDWSDSTYRNLLRLFKLDAKAKIAGFSKGMQRQMNLLLGLSSGARFLLLDESFDGLDVSKRDILKRLLRIYACKRNASIILSSHNMEELQDVSDRIGMIKDNELAFDRPVEDLSKGELSRLFLDEEEVSDDDLERLFVW